MKRILIYTCGTLEIRDLSQMIGSVLDPLDAVLDNSNIVLSLDDLVSEQPVVWVGAELPGQNTKVLLLLF